MLKQILRLIREGEVSSVDALARALNADVSLVQQMLEQLVTMGYLRQPEDACATSACARCPVSAGCHPSLRLWALTERGQRLLGD